MSDFDDRARTWDDDPAKVRRAELVAQSVRDRVSLGPGTRVLEYGAGTGLLSEQLVSDIGPLTLLDVSAGMREVLAEKVADGRLAGARVLDIDLSVGEPPAGETYDLIVSLMTLHHVDDVGRLLGVLRRMLAPDGDLVLFDLDAEDGSFHSDPSFTGHLGFERDELAELLVDAGLQVLGIDDCLDVHHGERAYPVFVAHARA
jgi:2-polyprenyl-3-methyl-5-hydroxy-6-metoxy-1,4-benzoquinol methylase